MARVGEELHRAGLEARTSGWVGELASFPGLVAQLEERGKAEDRALALLLRSAHVEADPSIGKVPGLKDIAAFKEGSAACRVYAALACAHGELSAIARAERGELQAWLDLHRALLGDVVDAEARLWLEAGELWLSWMRAERAGLDARAQVLAQEASGILCAPVVIDMSVLRALVAADEGDLEAAVQAARRGSRMAQTESMPQRQYLANIVLARTRRLCGKPHLSMRILSALTRVASPIWQSWIAWESMLAGGDEEALGAGKDQRLPMALGEVLDKAAAGDRRGFDRAATALRSRASAHAIAYEIDTLLYTIDPDSDLAAARADVRAFCEGKTAMPPSGLHGLCFRADTAPDEESSVAYVVSAPPARARRVLRLGVPLAEIDGESQRLHQTRRKQGRTETALAVLLLAGAKGMEERAFFHAVYGFAYSAPLHQGVLDVLLHRLRAHVGDAASVRREGEEILLTQQRALVVPDPRCAQPIEDRVLRYLASSGSGSAKDAAAALGIPLRTAQTALQQLTSDGACTVEKEGRNVAYVVEDTTFQEPTKY